MCLLLMPPTLSDQLNTELLRKQARQLLKQFRAGDAKAMATIQSLHPAPSAFGNFTDAQLVVARSYGFSDWAELCEASELSSVEIKTLAEKASLFIQLGCVQYQGNDRLRHYQRARDLLQIYPDIAEHDFFTALTSNNMQAVSRFLQTDSNLATTSGGPLDWPPLLYVTYSRVSDTRDNRDALAITRLLLENGADSDSHVILNDTYRFTALTGAMGEGEQGANQPPHPLAEELAALLLEAGASPNEGQGLYNTLFTDSGDKWLDLLVNHGLTKEHTLNWNATNDPSEISTIDFQLSCAVDSDRLGRVKTLLAAGGNPDITSPYNGRSIHTNARLAGHEVIAQYLIDHGATSEALNDEDQFRLACVNENTEAIDVLLEADTSLLSKADLLHAAAEHSSFTIVRALLERGFDVNGLSSQGRTLLHQLALKNDVQNIKGLLASGANAQIEDKTYHSTPAGFAAHSGSYGAMRLLLDQSDNLLSCVSCVYVDRIRELLNMNNNAIHDTTPKGNTGLHVIGLWLHDEPAYETYESVIELLLRAGADLSAKNHQDQTPAQFHRANGSENLADILEDFT